MKVDWDELKRLQGSDDPNNWMLFARILDKAWPSILAEREAAQRLRDAVGSYYGWGEMNMPPELLEVVAAFDKETE